MALQGWRLWVRTGSQFLQVTLTNLSQMWSLDYAVSQVAFSAVLILNISVETL